MPILTKPSKGKPTTTDKRQVTEDELADMKGSKTAPPAKAEPRAPKSMHACACGTVDEKGKVCNVMCYGTFAPGHDAKFKSRLIDTAINGDAKARAAAEKELASRGWTKFLDRKREIIEEKAADLANPKPKATKTKKANNLDGLICPNGVSVGDFEQAVVICREHGIEPPRKMSKATVESVLDGSYGKKMGWDDELPGDEDEDDDDSGDE